MVDMEVVKQFVNDAMQGNDASHDFGHCQRVMTVAVELAKEEGVGEDDIEMIKIAALLHDVGDYKYSGDEHAGVEQVQAFLEAQGYENIERVVAIIKGIGFKEELNSEGGKLPISRELAVVQDADRLDAIGAIGIARCFTYG